MTNENDNLNSWDNFIGLAFFKPSDLTNENDGYVVEDVEENYNDDGNANVRLIISQGNASYKFDLNKTNAVFLKENGVKSPKSTLGKKIFFKKVLVTNPRTKKEVDGIRITKIE